MRGAGGGCRMLFYFSLNMWQTMAIHEFSLQTIDKFAKIGRAFYSQLPNLCECSLPKA